MGVLNEISKYVETGPTPKKFMRYITHIFDDLTGAEDFIMKNIDDKKTKDLMLRYTQSMRESAVLTAEIFNDYVDTRNKEQEEQK